MVLCTPPARRWWLALVVGGCAPFAPSAEAEPVDGGSGVAVDGDATPSTDGAPGVEPLALDAFSRDVPIGFGSADLGGMWTTSGPLSVSGGTGRMRVAPGRGASAFLAEVASLDVDQEISASSEAFVQTGIVRIDVGLACRRGGDGARYGAAAAVRPGGTVELGISRRVDGADETLGGRIAIFSVAANESFRLRFRAHGTHPTLLQAKLWKVGELEPADWQIERSDDTPALQTAGPAGPFAYLSASATLSEVEILVDDYAAWPAPLRP